MKIPKSFHETYIATIREKYLSLNIVEMQGGGEKLKPDRNYYQVISNDRKTQQMCSQEPIIY